MSVPRRLLRAMAFTSLVILVIIALGVIVIETPWFKNRLRTFAVAQASSVVNGRLSIAHLSGSLFTGVELADVTIAEDGRQVVSARRIRIAYDPIDLLLHGIDLDRIAIDQPVVHVRHSARGWNLASLMKPTSGSGPSRPISIGAIVLDDGLVTIEDTAPDGQAVQLPARIERINASLSYASSPSGLEAVVHRVSLHAVQPALDLTDLSGTLVERDGSLTVHDLTLHTARSSVQAAGTIAHYQSKAPAVDLSIASPGVTIDEFAPFVPALAQLHLRPVFSIRARGPASAVRMTFDVHAASVGRLNGTVTADIRPATRQARGEVDLHDVNAAAIVGPAYTSDISAQLTFDLKLPAGGGPDGRYAITAPAITAAGYRLSNLAASGTIAGQRIAVDGRAQAYGTQATVQGTLTRGPELAYDVSGTFRGANLRALPGALKLPEVRSDLNADIHVRGRGRTLMGDVHLAESRVAGATILAGTRATFSNAGPQVVYSARGGIDGLDVQRAARAFHVTALSSDRYRSAINTRFTVRGTGTRLSALALDASGTLSHSTLLGGHVPHLALRAHLHQGALQAHLDGAFSGFDPAQLEARPALKGSVGGTVNLTAGLTHVGGPFNPADLTAAGQVTLDESRVGAFTIQSAGLDVQFANGIGHVRKFALVGPDLNVKANGTLSLDEATPSNLTYHLDTSRLATIGALVSQPVKGTLRVDGHVTGNRAALQTSGNLSAANLAYGANQALNITSEFQASVPNLQVMQGRYHADAAATFIKVAGQAINELAVNATYQSQRLTFQTTARQAPRQMQAAGTLVLYPHAAELQLQRLALSTTGLAWGLAPGTQAVIRYGQGRTDIRSLKLTNGNQSLSVDGVIAPAGNTLEASIANINLADLEQLLLINRHLAGRLDATAHITGTAQAPVVDARLNIADGAFRTFTFQSAGGTARYSPDGITVDMRLQENPAAWLAVRGTAPLSLFSSAAAKPGIRPAPVNLNLTTSTIDLGMIQGFTTMVTKASGSVQAQVHVGGTGEDPTVQGYLAVTNGAFAIPAAGTSYSGLNVRVNVTPDRVQIGQFTLVDDAHHSLNVSGEMDTHAKSLGAVNLSATASNFQILDNDLGRIGLDTKLQVTGKLTEAHVGGQLTVNQGRIDLSRLMALVGNSPYSTHPLASPRTAGQTANAKAGSTPSHPAARPSSTTSGMSLNVTIHVPDNFVIKGNDLRPAGSSFSVGDVNLTLGGDLHVFEPAGGQLRLNGIINTVRGQYVFQGRRFTIARDGHIRFENTYPPNPALDVTATRTIQGVDAQIHVGGTAKAPQLTLSSNPPLDQADILSLIVFNQPTDQLGEGQQTSLAQRAQGLATGFVAGSLTRSLGNALGLDMLQVQTAPEGGGGPEVTIGQQITNGLYVQVQQGVGAGSGTQFQLEYQFTDFLRLRTQADTGSQASQTLLHRVQQEGIDLIFFFSY